MSVKHYLTCGELYATLPLNIVAQCEVVLAADYLALIKAARDLMRYLDEHEWGYVPEGATADRLRSLIHPIYPMTGAYAPTATCRHGDHPFDCKLGCDPHSQADEEGKQK